MNSEYLTACEVLEKFPELREKLNWTETSIGLFIKNNLVEGFYNTSSRKAMVKVKSLLRLASYVNWCLEQRKIDLDGFGMDEPFDI